MASESLAPVAAISLKSSRIEVFSGALTPASNQSTLAK